MKFSANNFITPRNDFEPKSTGRKLTASVAEKSGDMSGLTGPTQNHDMLSLKIIEHPTKLNVSGLYKDEEDEGTMQNYVEDILGGIGSRRSSIRVNSLLFEEDSLQIKREMVRQKQEKYRENLEQRISVKFTANTAGSRRVSRRLMVSASAEDATSFGAPNSARNTIIHFEQTKNS